MAKSAKWEAVAKAVEQDPERFGITRDDSPGSLGAAREAIQHAHASRPEPDSCASHTIEFTGREERWQFDEEAIRAAVKELGIRLPLVLKYSGGGERTLGSHRLKRCIHGDAYHVINVGRDGDEAEVDDTIWHELAHAMQAERLGVDTWEQQQYIDRDRHAIRQTEDEADEIAKQHVDEKLTKPQMVYVGLDGKMILLTRAEADEFADAQMRGDNAALSRLAAQGRPK